MFRPSGSDDTKLRRNETVFLLHEDIRKRALGYQPTHQMKGHKGPMTGTVMIKALSAITIAAFVAAALTVLPGFAPQVEASVPAPLAKGDRLDTHKVDTHKVGGNCSQQAWPNFEASCLRVVGSKMLIREARLVTADRTP
jgi:hypothetical protein